MVFGLRVGTVSWRCLLDEVMVLCFRDEAVLPANEVRPGTGGVVTDTIALPLLLACGAPLLLWSTAMLSTSCWSLGEMPGLLAVVP